MTAPTFSFTVTGATHDDVMAEARLVAHRYWGRNSYDIVKLEAELYNGQISAYVTTQLHGVAS